MISLKRNRPYERSRTRIDMEMLIGKIRSHCTKSPRYCMQTLLLKQPQNRLISTKLKFCFNS